MQHEAAGTSPAGAPLLGQRVVLGGLSSRPELNGQRGVAQSFEGGRYAVALEGGGESVRVRPGNLSPVAAERASQAVPRQPPMRSWQRLGEATRLRCWCGSTVAGGLTRRTREAT